MNKKIYLIIICIICSNAAFAQHKIKVYFIDKINPEQLLNDPKKYSINMKFQSIGVELYKYNKGIKEDSLFVIAEALHCWNDSLSYSVEVPSRFFNNGATLKFSPTFYLKKNKEKGGLANYLTGKEQSIVQIKLKIKSEPSGAKVYLVPKLYWEREPLVAKLNTQALMPYLVSEGTTTVNTYVQEYVYMAIFKYKRKFSIVQVIPNHLHPIDSVFTKFN